MSEVLVLCCEGPKGMLRRQAREAGVSVPDQGRVRVVAELVERRWPAVAAQLGRRLALACACTFVEAAAREDGL